MTVPRSPGTHVAVDRMLLTTLEADADTAEDQIARLLPDTPFAVLTSTPGWSTIRAGRYGVAIGDPAAGPRPGRSTAPLG